jgi:hypothetical protein
MWLWGHQAPDDSKNSAFQVLHAPPPVAIFFEILQSDDNFINVGDLNCHQRMDPLGFPPFSSGVHILDTLSHFRYVPGHNTFFIFFGP